MKHAHPIAAAAITAVLLVGCTPPSDTTVGDAPSSVAVSATPSTATPSAPAPTGSPTASPPAVSATPTKAATSKAAPAADVTVAVVVKDDKVSPNGDNVRAKTGQRIRITLDSDVAESIHVHGYDKTVEVKPGGNGQVTFTADQKGVFEVETHETAKLAVKLIVS